MRVDLVDPPAYSPPYDHALASALARLGDTSVRLVTSEFAYGAPSPPEGYEREEFFYRHARGPAGSRLRALSKRAEHPLDMLRYRRGVDRRSQARRAGDGPPDVVHIQWLTVPRLDLRLLPARPTVLTIHDPLERGRAPLPASAFSRVDAVVVHSEFARQAVVEQHGIEPERVHVIRHGALGPASGANPASAGEAFSVPTPHNASLARHTSRPRPDTPADLRAERELVDDGSPVVLSYGLIRPYKGVHTLLEAWRGIDNAQLWVVGRPMMDLAPLTAGIPPRAQVVPRFVTPQEEAALFERADIVVLPYEESERFGFSGVLATALGYGKPIVLSDIGGFDEVTALGAARGVPPGDPRALHATLKELIADESQRARLAAAAAEAASKEYSWDAAARATLELYAKIASQ